MDTEVTNQESADEQSQKNVLGDVEIVNGIACPIDPQERLECESCQ